LGAIRDRSCHVNGVLIEVPMISPSFGEKMGTIASG